jgi:hypothetical protein
MFSETTMVVLIICATLVLISWINRDRPERPHKRRGDGQ